MVSVIAILCIRLAGPWTATIHEEAAQKAWDAKEKDKHARRKSLLKEEMSHTYGKVSRMERFAGGARTIGGMQDQDKDWFDGNSRAKARMPVYSAKDLLGKDWKVVDLYLDSSEAPKKLGTFLQAL